MFPNGQGHPPKNPGLPLWAPFRPKTWDPGSRLWEKRVYPGCVPGFQPDLWAHGEKLRRRDGWYDQKNPVHGRNPVYERLQRFPGVRFLCKAWHGKDDRPINDCQRLVCQGESGTVYGGYQRPYLLRPAIRKNRWSLGNVRSQAAGADGWQGSGRW